MLFFKVLAHYGYEFGFRTALEISRFVKKYFMGDSTGRSILG